MNMNKNTNINMYNNLLVSFSNGVSTIIINRPDIRNALNKETWFELDSAINQIDKDDQTRVVIITGAGDNVFAAGADIKWLNARETLDVLNYSGQEILLKLENMSKPVIAAVNGIALGGGCELAMACDIRVASESSKFGQPEVNLGIIPGAGGTQRLSRLVGYGKAKELILTGDIITAQEACSIGLVNKVVKHDDLMKEVMEIAYKMMSKGPVAVRLAKAAVNIGVSTDIHTGMAFEKLAQAIAFSTQDRKEGTGAFLEKRKPNFIGE